MKYFFLMLIFAFSLSNAQPVQNTVASPLQPQAYSASTVNSLPQYNYYYKGGHFIINVTTVNSGTYTPHIQGYDSASGQWYDILVGSTISSSGLTVLKIYPGIGVSANAAASDILPLQWRVQLVGANTPSMVVSVDANLIP